mmetsp:Transcript_14916/g.30229  ORF Transcript_14916/g.30229 Transcript_14916/m.30229 type:complete len:215 (-) Transcript_14916:782-1426(-)
MRVTTSASFTSSLTKKGVSTMGMVRWLGRRLRGPLQRRGGSGRLSLGLLLRDERGLLRSGNPRASSIHVRVRVCLPIVIRRLRWRGLWLWAAITRTSCRRGLYGRRCVREKVHMSSPRHARRHCTPPRRIEPSTATPPRSSPRGLCLSCLDRLMLRARWWHMGRPSRTRSPGELVSASHLRRGVSRCPSCRSSCRCGASPTHVGRSWLLWGFLL